MSDDTATPARPFEHAPWTRQAQCHGLTHIFFPRPAESTLDRDAREARAKAVCATCPVIEQCRAQRADEAQHGGVWGGMSPTDDDGIVHDTYAGYRRHCRNGETACDPCRLAYNAYQARAKARRLAARIEQMQRAAEFRNNGGHAIDWTEGVA